MTEIEDRSEAEMREALANAARLARPQTIAAARVQLTCAAVSGMTSGDWKYHKDIAETAVGVADACLALLFPEPA